MAKPYDYINKLIVVGDAGVGKTSFVMRWGLDQFEEGHICTIGLDFTVRTVDIHGKVVKVQLWDTYGQERFRPVMRAYFRAAHGVIIAYDVSDEETFASVRYWKQEAEKHASKDVRLALIGCKSDLGSKRAVNYDEGKALAGELGVHFFAETSSKLGDNVDDAVTTMLNNIMTHLNPKCVILTLLSVAASDDSCNIKVSFATLGGDTFDVAVDMESATVAAVISRIFEKRGLQHVKLVTLEGAMLTTEQRLPGVPTRRSFAGGCVAQ